MEKTGSKLKAIDREPEEVPSPETEKFGEKLVSLDRKVSDMENKLTDLKHQLDNNLLQNEDINAEASEKKPVGSTSVIEMTKAMSNEVMNHVTIEIENLRQATNNMDRKLQFHVNLVSERLGTIYNMMTDVHDAILVGGTRNGRPAWNVTTMKTTEPSAKESKIDRLVEQIYPVLTVSEKMDEVWNVVVSGDEMIVDPSSLLGFSWTGWHKKFGGRPFAKIRGITDANATTRKSNQRNPRRFKI